MATRESLREWKADEAVLNLEEFMVAAQREPQHLTWRGRHYVMSCQDGGGDTAQDFLRRGGPLGEGESLG